VPLLWTWDENWLLFPVAWGIDENHGILPAIWGKDYLHVFPFLWTWGDRWLFFPFAWDAEFTPGGGDEVEVSFKLTWRMESLVFHVVEEDFETEMVVYVTLYDSDGSNTVLELDRRRGQRTDWHLCLFVW